MAKRCARRIVRFYIIKFDKTNIGFILMLDLFDEIIAGILLFILGLLGNKVYNYFRLTRPLSKVLGSLANNTKRTIVVVPKLYSHVEAIKLKRPGDTTETIQWPTSLPLFAEGDSKAMMYIYNLLLKFTHFSHEYFSSSIF